MRLRTVRLLLGSQRYGRRSGQGLLLENVLWKRERVAFMVGVLHARRLRGRGWEQAIIEISIYTRHHPSTQSHVTPGQTYCLSQSFQHLGQCSNIVYGAPSSFPTDSSYPSVLYGTTMSSLAVHSSLHQHRSQPSPRSPDLLYRSYELDTRLSSQPISPFKLSRQPRTEPGTSIT